MPRAIAIAAALTLGTLAACDSAPEPQADVAVTPVEQPTANIPPAAVDAAPAALGLSEAQLLDADLIAADGTDLGDIEQVRRNAAGEVDGLIVEIENSDPDRFVIVPLTGLTTRTQAGDTDVQTNTTAADLAKLPDAPTPSQ